jgi:hypothetical protein
MTKILRRVTLGLALGMLFASPALAVVNLHTWAATAADSWSNALAWSPLGPPDASDSVLFNATSDSACVVNGSPTCGVLLMNTGAGTVTIKSGGALTVSSFTQSAGAFIDNGGTLTSHGDLVIGGTVVFTSTGLEVMDGTGNLSNSTASVFASLSVTGTGSIVATRTGAVYAKIVLVGDEDTIKGSPVLNIRPAANNFVAVTGAGAITGGATDIRIAANTTLWAVGIAEPVTIHGSVVTDTFTQTGNFSAYGLTVGDSLTFVDSGFTVTSRGGLVIDTVATLVKSSGAWTQSATGNLSNPTAANVLKSLTVSGTGTIVATMTGTVCANALTIGAADSVKGAATMRMRPATNDFIAIGSGGSLSGGGLSVSATADVSLAAVTIGEYLTINAGSVADSLTLTGALSTKGLTVGPSVSLVDGGFAVTSAGNLLISDTATAIHSTGVWTQSASGTVKNADTSNAFDGYVVSDGGAGGIKVVMADSVYCRSVSIGANDTLGFAANELGIVNPDANNFITQASGAVMNTTVASGSDICVFLVAGSYSNGAFTLGDGIDLAFYSVRSGDTVRASGAWTLSDGAFSVVNGVTTVEGSSVIDMDNYALTASSFDMAAVESTLTLLGGNATHVVDTVQFTALTSHIPTLNMESSHWRTNFFDLDAGRVVVLGAGARILLSEGTGPNIPLNITGLPAVVCSTAAKPTIHGSAGSCSTLVVSAVCVDTVFLDTAATGDTIKVLSQFLANGTRGSTHLYGNPGGTAMLLPLDSKASDCIVENIKAVGGHVLLAYGCVPRGHNSGGVVFQQ